MTDQERIPFQATTGGAHYDAIEHLPVAVMLDNVRSLYNVGSLFRTADAASIERLVLSGFTGRPPHKGIAKTALGAEAAVPWDGAASGLEAARLYRQRGYEIAALETSIRSVDLYDWAPRFPVLLILGNEVDGLGAELLEMSDTHVRIPMLGMKYSLNVATAAGVAIYELLRKYRALLQGSR